MIRKCVSCNIRQSMYGEDKCYPCSRGTAARIHERDQVFHLINGRRM